MTKPISVKLLDQIIPATVAAELLGCDPDIFGDGQRMTLREAFRLAMRPAVQDRHIARGERRAILRKQVAANRRAVASIPARDAATAIKVAANDRHSELWAMAAQLSGVSPKAAARLRDAARAAMDAANVEASRVRDCGQARLVLP